MSLLEVKGLTKNFGGLSAVSNVSLKAEKGELIGLIGPNGAGKTTFFNLLTGVYIPTEGTIELETENGKTLLNGIAPNKITELGLARTFQNIRLFKDLTVLENVMVAMHGAKQGLQTTCMSCRFAICKTCNYQGSLKSQPFHTV